MPVKIVDVVSKTDSIQVTWKPGSGISENYKLILWSQERTINEVNVDAHVTVHTFHGLLPGHVYNITVITEAAGLQNGNSKLARTGNPRADIY